MFGSFGRRDFRVALRPPTTDREGGHENTMRDSAGSRHSFLCAACVPTPPQRANLPDTEGQTYRAEKAIGSIRKSALRHSAQLSEKGL